MKAFIVRSRNASSTSSCIFSIWAMQFSMHINVSLGALEEIISKVKKKVKNFYMKSWKFSLWGIV